ncbi:MAG: hypothetical protein KDD58_14930 [Bdellovibrionales bacterium]|nr:hypothetical protein [Bdellovibrionales bacterium]
MKVIIEVKSIIMKTIVLLSCLFCFSPIYASQLVEVRGRVLHIDKGIAFIKTNESTVKVKMSKLSKKNKNFININSGSKKEFTLWLPMNVFKK